MLTMFRCLGIMSPLWFVVEVEVILIWKVCQVRKLEILELEREPGCVFQVGWGAVGI
jgi:hypothetical protein